MFNELEGPITRQVREEAVALTGLKWSKIYKWLFDQGDKLPVYRRQQSPQTSFDTLNESNFRCLQIFEIRKVVNKGASFTN